MAVVKIILWFRFFTASLYQLYLFQLKEYRFDRLREHFSRENLFTFTLLAPLSVKKLPRPTPKSMLFFLCQLGFVLLSGLLWISVIFPLAFVFAALILIVVDWLVVKVLVLGATEVIEKWRKNGLKVIGVTGSFGKTTTVNFLSCLLKKSLTPPLGTNIEKAIACWVIKNRRKKADFLIVELGAYKEGEIAALCRWLKPEIAVVTGIGNQHLALFGSKKKLLAAKREILRFAKTGFFNWRSKGSRQIGRSFGGQRIFYGQKIKAEEKVYFRKRWRAYQRFVIGSRWRGKVKFLGRHFLTDLAGALSVAAYLGESDFDFFRLELPPKRLALKTGQKGALILDSSYNQSEESIMAGLELLKTLNFKKKFIFISKLIELGQEEKRLEGRIERKKGSKIERINKEKLRDLLKNAGSETAIFLFGREAALY